MGWISDLGDEWKKAKTPEKVLIVGIVVAVVGIALYERNKNAAAGQPAQASGTFSMPQNQGAVPSGGGVNVNSGGGGTPSGGGSSGSGGSSGGTQGGGNPPTNPIPQPNSSGPLIPYGQYNGPSYSAGQFKWGSTYTYNGTTYQIAPGSNGILWGAPITGPSLFSQQQFNQIPIGPGQKVALYGPQSSYNTASSNSNIKQGGGPFGTRVAARGRRTPAPNREGQPTVTARVYARRIA